MGLFSRKKTELSDYDMRDLRELAGQCHYVLDKFVLSLADLVVLLKARPALTSYVHTKVLPRCMSKAMSNDIPGVLKVLGEDPVIGPTLATAVQTFVKALG